MKIKLEGFDIKNNPINLPQPIWFNFLINSYGTNKSFEFTFLEEITDDLTHLTVKMDNQPEISLIVDKIQKINKNKKTFFNLTATHSPLCYIWQNNVIPETFNDLKMNDFFEKFCKPFGIHSIKPAMTNAKAKLFYTTLGMTYWDSICLFFKKEFNVSVFVNEKNQIVTKFIPKPMITFTTNDPDLIYFNKMFDRTKLLSTVFIQHPDDEPNQFTRLNLVDSVAEKKGIKRAKFFKLPRQYAMLPNRGARVLVDKFNMNHKTLEIEFARTMSPIYPGSIIIIKENGKKNELCVYSFCTGISRQGPFTHIELCYSNYVN